MCGRKWMRVEAERKGKATKKTPFRINLDVGDAAREDTAASQ
jgi:hypothetical protein